MKRFLTVLVLAWAGLALNLAWAHGDVKPRHGGVAQEVNDLVFELVSHASGAAIYIDDHGQAVKPAGMSGKITVLQGGEKKDYPLVPGADRIEVPGLTLVKGARAVAVITGVGGKTMTVRFSLK